MFALLVGRCSSSVGYVLMFKDGTRESRIAQLARLADGWKIVEGL